MKMPPPDLAGRLLEVSESFLTDDPPQRLEDVAKSIGASRASLYYYFSGRDDLVTFMITQHAVDAAAVMDAALARAGDAPASRLEAAVDALAEFLGAHPGLCSGMLASTGATERFAEVMRINRELVVGPLSRLVAAVMSDGGAADVGSPAIDATNALMGGLLLGVLGRWMAGGDPTDVDFRRRLVRQVAAGVSHHTD